MAFLDKNAIFRPNIELEAIARQSVEASREVDCAHFSNIGRNSRYFLLPIFLGSYLNGHAIKISDIKVASCRDDLIHILWQELGDGSSCSRSYLTEIGELFTKVFHIYI